MHTETMARESTPGVARQTKESISVVLLIAELTTEERERFETATARADVRLAAVADADAGRALLDAGGLTPTCLFLDPSIEGVEALVAWLRSDPRWLGLPIIALANRPTESAFVRAHALGVDDVALRSDPGAATRRLAALDGASWSRGMQTSRGKAWIAHSSEHRRRVLGCVLRRAGFDVGFAGGPDELVSAVVGAPNTELVVIGGDVGDGGEGDLIRRLRIEADKPELPAVVLRPPTPTDHTGETMGRLGIVSDDTAADNLLFVVNELGARVGSDARSSQRLLFSTLCAFRREHELSGDFGLTYNVSREGLYVRTTDPPPMGSAVWLELRPPGDSAIVHLRGKVMWIRELGSTRGGTTPSGFGIRILEECCPPPDLARYRLAYHAFREEPKPYSVDDLCGEDEGPVEGSEPPRQGRILVVDDDEQIIKVYRRLLGRLGYDVVAAEDGSTAIALFATRRFDTVLTDLHMPGVGGMEVLHAIRDQNESVPVIIVTGAPSTESAIEAVQLGAYRYLTKPLDHVEVAEIVSRAVAVGRLAELKREALVLHADSLGHRSKEEDNAAFDRALDGLFLHYQPIVSWRTKSVYGYEALVRSREPSLPHPGALFDAATELGRLDQIGRSIRQLAPEPFSEETERLFVNLHPLDLLDERLFSEDTPLAAMATQVTLEITERASLSEIPEAKRRIGELREMGFSIAVDDIGAGYAGLTSFAQLEPDVAKLDMTLIRDVHRLPTKQRLIRTFCELCSDLGIALIAEGVETVEERDVLIELGCDLFQGYLFARPGLPFPDCNF